MKKQLVIISSLLLSASFCGGQDSAGIRFLENAKWKDVLMTAKAENKLIFVDIYTSWCGPCKRMSQDVFTQKKVGDRYNASFVNYKVDAEKGEGIEIAKKYNIRAYPTYLFVDGNGTLFYTVTSYMPATQFIQQASIALAEFKDPKPLPVWDKEFESGKSDPAFLLAYLQKRTKLKKDNTGLIALYFSKVPKTEWITHDHVLLLIRNPVIKINSAIFNALAKNIEQAERLIKGEQFPGSTHDMLYVLQLKALHQLIETNDIKKFETEFIKCNHIMPEVISTKPWFTKQKDDYWRLYFYKNTRRYDQFIALADRYYEKEYMYLSHQQIVEQDSILMERALSVYRDTSNVKMEIQTGLVEMTRQAFTNYFSNLLAGELTAASQIVLLHLKNKAMFFKALQWVQKSYEVKPEPENMYIQGLLHYKLNKPKEAIKWLEMAVNATKDEKLLSKINIVLTVVKEGRPFENIIADF